MAAYGFHADNPIGMTEDWPTRPADHSFYAQEKAELEETLAKEAAAHPELDLYLLRPPIVLGPHAVGGKSELANRLLPRVGRMAAGLRRSPVRMPVPVPDLPVQVIHEDDVGTAFLQCIVGAGRPVPTTSRPRGCSPAPTSLAVSACMRSQCRPGRSNGWLVASPDCRCRRRLAPMTSWVESSSHPSIMDTSKAQRDLGWKPQHAALDALRDTI